MIYLSSDPSSQEFASWHLELYKNLERKCTLFLASSTIIICKIFGPMSSLSTGRQLKFLLRFHNFIKQIKGKLQIFYLSQFKKYIWFNIEFEKFVFRVWRYRWASFSLPCKANLHPWLLKDNFRGIKVGTKPSLCKRFDVSSLRSRM